MSCMSTGGRLHSRRNVLLSAAAIGLFGSPAFASPKAAYAATVAQLPFPVDHIFRDWGTRSLPSNPLHRGTDFGRYAANLPGTAVRVVAPGRVFLRAESNTHGYHLGVDHGQDASGRNWWTRYHMLNNAGRPAENTMVAADDQIGSIAGTHWDPEYWTGPHLHFEVHTDDPAFHTNGFQTSVDPVDCVHMIPMGAPAPPIPEPESENAMFLFETTQANGALWGATQKFLVSAGFSHALSWAQATELHFTAEDLIPVSNAEFTSWLNRFRVPVSRVRGYSAAHDVKTTADKLVIQHEGTGAKSVVGDGYGYTFADNDEYETWRNILTNSGYEVPAVLVVPNWSWNLMRRASGISA